MHENQISESIIGAAIEVHKELGPGLIEWLYEDALCIEFELRGIRYERQKKVPVWYKGRRLSDDMKLDLLVEDKVIIDLKAKEQFSPTDKPKLLTYLRLSDLRLGLLMNFHEPRLIDGICRVVNRLTDTP